ncbi:hypothetical protein DR950_34350 [Kitasatospora xanthocidica]|uniref:Protein kinase domain-containing protein n=1 Tax=Kitasatospora xanthocidica TaxID=83382 RepID=A0A373A3K6_9ACTN|nr:hypothetical protein DR950_34350 [Kitasatospora xanthocidica]
MVTTPGPGPRSGEPARAKHVELSFLTPDGRRNRTWARFGPDTGPLSRGPVRTRNTLLNNTVKCVQVRAAGTDAPGGAQAAFASSAAIDAETAVALRLHRALGAPGASGPFPVLIGYELDAAEPFALYRPPRGRTVERMHGLPGAQLRVIEQELVDALAVLAELGLVHHGIAPETVRWDGRRIQLWGLDAVTHTGRPRTPRGAAPYAPPEVREGAGRSDPRDGLWSAAQVMYSLVTGRPGAPDRPPPDLADHRSLAHTMGSSFAPRAADRPTPAALLALLAPDRAPAADRLPADGLAAHRAGYDRALASKRPAGAVAPGEAVGEAVGHPAGAPTGEVLCPYCLEPIRYDPTALHTPDAVQELRPYNPHAQPNPRLLADELRGAFQLCPGNGTVREHHIPVPYLTNGRPLTVAMIGQSNTGKSHLLTQMVAEIADDRLKPYGISWQSVNPRQHAGFLNSRVVPLRDGRVLAHTAGLGQDETARFVESLLITDASGRTRPLAFFDLAGEDLLRTDALLRFLLGIDALIFVVDPTIAMPLAQLDEVRTTLDQHVNRDGDPAFATVLDRVPRTGPYLTVPSAVVVAKADLLRSEPPVDRWLGEPGHTALSRRRLHEESRDVYALLDRDAGKAWLRPFDTALHCTLHVASATGGRQEDSRYPRGVRAQRVLEPLLSLFAMHGIVELPEGRPVDEVDR